MNKPQKKEQSSLPLCPNPNCQQSHVVHNGSHRAQRALRLPVADGVRRYHHRSPAMALGLTDHRWSFQELLITRIPITP